MPAERDLFEDARQEMLMLREENKTLKSERDHAVQLNMTMSAEIDSLRRDMSRMDTTIIADRADHNEQLAECSKTIRMLQAFATAFVTRIDDGVALLGKARQEANDQMIRLGLSANSEHTAEEEGARAIIERVVPLHALS